MAKVLNVYKGEEVVQYTEVGENGSAKATISGLDAGTEYPKGTFQVTFSNEAGESAKVDVPTFTTNQATETGEPEA
ncbi:major tail protein [Staphylococcus phage phiSA_BS1]|uniref:Major tail protein n=2 Tax=Baoshanvirus TaxID=2732969 RepID=A0A2P1MXM4_9CAUD|nr:major tail protein [Staphylococcus phage phiSA_BS1]YP_009800001.1 major tail protein [Staphylococcus phage phiSA_BS2]AVP40323.1 major tail protein [Staphylococcus phage phiSA_BS1]AVR55605.1 major tail protein [Staphylococcus phage phiSA_BS2]